MNDIELGWLAGIFEGEGCLSLRRDHRRPGRRYWHARVAMSDQDVIRRLHEVAGIGTMYGPHYRQDRPGNKPMWEWRVGRQEDVVNLCALLISHMGERRAEKMSKCIEDMENS